MSCGHITIIYKLNPVCSALSSCLDLISDLKTGCTRSIFIISSSSMSDGPCSCWLLKAPRPPSVCFLAASPSSSKSLLCPSALQSWIPTAAQIWTLAHMMTSLLRLLYLHIHLRTLLMVPRIHLCQLPYRLLLSFRQVIATWQFWAITPHIRCLQTKMEVKTCSHHQTTPPYRFQAQSQASAWDPGLSPG